MADICPTATAPPSTAEQGNADAQFRLAMSLAQGVGGKKSDSGPQVEKWLLRAMRQGHPEAKAALDDARSAGLLRPEIHESPVLRKEMRIVFSSLRPPGSAS